jgi:transcriptional regulator with GAF, ATPase, and Fis domain
LSCRALRATHAHTPSRRAPPSSAKYHLHLEPAPPLEEDLESLVLSASFPVAVFDADCRYTFVNPAAATFSHMSVEEHIGRPIEDVAPDIAASTRELAKRIFAGGRLETVALGDDDTGLIITYFRFFSRRDDAARMAVVCMPASQPKESPSHMWRARLGFESLVAHTAARLLMAPPDQFNAVVCEALGEICESQLYPCAAVIRFDKERSDITVSHEWRRTALFLDHQKPVPPALLAFVAGVSEPPHGSQYIPLCDFPASLEPLAAKVKYSLGAEGIALFPFCFDGSPAGAVAFLVRSYERDAGSVARRLRTFSDLIASALLRHEKERALAAALESTSQQKQVIANERDYLLEEMERELGASFIVHTSAAMRQVLEHARTVAQTPATALVRGESGVGKELIARAIHQASSRRDTPLVKVNCASIPRELFESEFFGHTRGAFTGALRDRIGRFELAHGGTLFLDEIGEIPLAEQDKLLRVIQEGEFERVGEDRTRRVDVRIIAATNRRLERDVEEGRFRRDLYFRLNVFPIEVPPLRERTDDVVPLAEHFIATYSARMGRKGLELSGSDREKLAAYSWPGNVRELANVIERSVILAKEDRFSVLIPSAPSTPSDFPRAAGSVAEPAQAVQRPGTLASLRELEMDMIEGALRASSGRISGKEGAAERLGIHPSTLRDRIKSLGLRH